MKNYFILVFIFVICVLGAFFFGRSLYAPEVGENKEEQTKLGIEMSVVEIREVENKLYNVVVEYPQFDSASDEFNNSIKQVIEERVVEFKKIVEENWLARQETLPQGVEREEFPQAPYLFSGEWNSEQLNNRYASFILRFHSYEGGANTRQTIKTFNYDFMKNKPVELTDLFPEEGDNYLDKISKNARNSLILNLNSITSGEAPTDMIISGTEPELKNFENFVFNDQVVTFYFPKYQVGPGALGEQNITIPRVITK